MIKLVWNAKFKKKYKKWSKKNPELIEIYSEKILLFEKNPFTNTLKTHPLTGRLESFWALRITFDHRLIFKFDKEKTVAVLVNIGKHDEVY